CDDTQAGVLWANWFDDPAVLLARQRMLADVYGVDWEWVDRRELRDRLHTTRYGDALFEPRAFHFNPLKYITGLAAVVSAGGVAIHEHTPAVSLERVGPGWRIGTADGEVLSDEVVLACGGYLAGLRREVDAGVMTIATYVMAPAPLGPRLQEVMSTPAAVYDTRFAFDYYRPLPDSRLLWGGRISVRDRPPHEVERLLRRDMLRVFPQLGDVRIEQAWSGLMSYARHQMPQIGQVEPGLWLAQAVGGHGVAPTTFAGELRASAIAEGDTRWRGLADFGLVTAAKPAGLAAAQLSYWWAQSLDAWRDWRESRGRAAAGEDSPATNPRLLPAGKRARWVTRFPRPAWGQIASKMPAAPMPVPMHIVTIPYFCWRRRIPCTMVAVRTAPVAPRGCPSAIAPPSG